LESIITTKNVTKIYKSGGSKIYALNSVSCEVYKGEFCAVVGTSGSGKTTFLNLLAGLDRPSAGKVIVNGKAISKFSEQKLSDFRLNNIGYVLQSYGLLSFLTIKENIALPLTIIGVERKEREKRVLGLMERLGLAGHGGLFPEQLSGGLQQRAAIARAIINNPPIVFADEPTGNLDIKNANNIIEAFKNLVAENGSTIIMVTHDMEKAECADRMICFSDGRIASSGQ